MKTHRRLFVTIVCVIATLSNIVVAGQERRVPMQVVPPEGNRVWVGGGPGQVAMAGAQGDSTFVFVSSEMSIDGKVVKGAPYSAQAVNESVQTLVGGNRIVRQSTATIYRDSEGRTRREQTISVVGGFSAEGGPTQTTFINDPVASVNYILDVKNRTARKIDYSAKIAAEKMLVDTMKAKRSSEGGAAGGVEKTPPEKAAVIAELKARRAAEAGPAGEATEKIVVEKAAAAGEFRYEMRTGGGPPPVFAGQGPAGFVMMGNKKNTRKEDLGKQTVEGVEAEGTRYTTTIPAGEIGNEQPIEMVQESWFSPELQTLVMSKHSDPRFGESTYRLTNINRAEPPRSLFEVPSDYTIQEAGPRRREPSPQGESVGPEMRRKIELEKRRPGSEQ